MRAYLPNEVFTLSHYQNAETGRHTYLTGLAVDCYTNRDPDICTHADRNSHYAARECMWSGRTKTAIREFSRHIAMNRWPAERAQSMIFKGDCLSRLGQELEAKKCWMEAFEIEPNRREPLMRLA